MTPDHGILSVDSAIDWIQPAPWEDWGPRHSSASKGCRHPRPGAIAEVPTHGKEFYTNATLEDTMAMGPSRKAFMECPLTARINTCHSRCLSPTGKSKGNLWF